VSASGIFAYFVYHKREFNRYRNAAIVGHL
jgi:hypothetical protein